MPTDMFLVCVGVHGGDAMTERCLKGSEKVWLFLMMSHRVNPQAIPVFWGPSTYHGAWTQLYPLSSRKRPFRGGYSSGDTH